MSGEKRHFRARVEAEWEIEIELVPVDILISSTYAGMTASPLTGKGRAFLADYHNPPRAYAGTPIGIQPGRFWEVFRADLKAAGLRAQYDYSGNGKEVE